MSHASNKRPISDIAASPIKPDAAANRPLVVWDFDWSLINENSDTYVVEQLDKSNKIWNEAEKKFSAGLGWTQLMDWCAGALHADGHAPDAIRSTLAGVPILDGALAAVAAAAAVGAEQRILSDANDVYIESVLKARGLEDAFSLVVTNPASFNDAGRLEIRPHQPVDKPHSSSLCPPNLCKGAILSKWLDELQPSCCVYVGDGGGDFCPATRLRAGDTVLARRAPHDSLLRKCRNNKGRIKAKVVEWGGASDPRGEALRRGMEGALPAGEKI